MRRATREDAPAGRPLVPHAPDAMRHVAARRLGAAQLEPDARLVVAAHDPPTVRHLVHEHEPEPTRLERVEAVLALDRDPAGAPGVAHLDVRALAPAPRAQPDALVVAQPGVTHAVGHELRDEQEERRLTVAGDEPVARHGAARLARRRRRGGDCQIQLGIGDHACTNLVPRPFRGANASRYSTFASALSVGPGWRRGTSTRRLNSATSTPSWLSTRVCTLTVPRSGLDCDSRFSSTSDSTNSVSPWKTGAGCLSSSVARLAIAFPDTSETLIPRASE